MNKSGPNGTTVPLRKCTHICTLMSHHNNNRIGIDELVHFVFLEKKNTLPKKRIVGTVLMIQLMHKALTSAYL